jgi:hypothetical protein
MMVVESLLGHAQTDLALECLGSLQRCSKEPLTLRLRDDGSLTAADRERLAVLGEPEIVPRVRADERVEPLLSRHPASLRYRREHPLGMKLFDGVLGESGTLRFCDSDVLFLRPVSRVFPDDPGEPRFLEDVQNAYSLRSWQLARHRLRIGRRINSGLLAFPREAFDLDQVEWYLSRPEMAFAPMWREQTAWALLAATRPSTTFDRWSFRIAKGPPTPADAAQPPIALHFVSPSRGFLPAWRGLSGPELPVRAKRTRVLSAARLACDELARRWRRI